MAKENTPKVSKVRVRITPEQKAMLDLLALAQRTGSKVIVLPDVRITPENGAYIVCSPAVSQTRPQDCRQQQAQRGSIRKSEEFTCLLGDYARAFARFQHEHNDAETEEKRALMQEWRKAEQALETFIETFYAGK